MLRWLLVLGLGLMLSASTVYGEKPSAAAARLAKGNAEFAVELYEQLAKDPGNVVFSPYSISSALGMTYGGARNNTADEMQHALNFPFGQDKVHPAFDALNASLSAAAQQEGVKFNIANGLCLTGGNLSEEFQNLIVTNYNAELFAGDVNKINNWVKQKTEGKIEKILDKLSPNSVAVLLNAIYFKGEWNLQFEKDYTRDAPFTLADGKQVDLPLMYQRNEFAILEKPDFQVASLPYAGGRLSMVVLLPQQNHQLGLLDAPRREKADDGLAKLEKQLTADKLQSILAELDKAQPVKSDLYLPQFRLEASYDLISACQALGMKDAFDPRQADFSGMGWTKGSLWISQIKHKAFMEVNEQGTEAAAATAVEVQTRSFRRYPVFRADHPFLFLIRDQQTGSILFMGRMVDPREKSE